MINRILIVGSGSAGNRHLKIARTFFPAADIKILRHSHANTIPAESNGYFVGVEEAIEFAPQIAVIANPAPFHIEIATRLAMEKTNLLIEKPMAVSIDGTQNLLKICRDNRTVLSVGYNLRFSTSLLEFKKYIWEGRIGKVLSVRGEVGHYLPSWRPQIDYRKSVSAQSSLGGGVLLELSHEIDYLRWIFGEAIWVRATLANQSNLEVDVEDSAHMTLAFQGITQSEQILCSLNMDFIRHDKTRVCTVIGEKGTIRWDGVEGNVAIREESSNAWEKLYSSEDSIDETYMSEWRDFLHCISNNTSPIGTGIDGVRVIEIINAARRSSLTGSQIEVIRNRTPIELNP